MLTEQEIMDVIVVGTGPAGNSTSITCATRGLKVLQIERERLPRRKACGGGLSPKSLRAFPVPIEEVIERRIKSAWVCTGPNQVVTRELLRPGAMVCRERLDHVMAESARSAGALLLDGCAFLGVEHDPDGLLRVRTSRGAFRTRILVGADGIHSSIRRQVFPKARLLKAQAIEAVIAPSQGVLEALDTRAVMDFQGIQGGYGWIFPKRDHVNVGLYRLHRTPENTDLKQALHRYIQSNPLLQNAQVGEIRGFEIPIKPVSRKLVKGNVVLVGDAAGIGEAFYGEGIYFAITSGRTAGDCIADHLQEARPLGAYSKQMRGLARDLFAARLTANLFYRLPAPIVERMTRSPLINRLFERALSGDISPWRCLLGTLAGLPFWALGPRYSTMSTHQAMREAGLPPSPAFETHGTH